MFMFHIAFSLSLIALTLGAALMVFAGCKGMSSCFAKLIGLIVVVLSLASSACIGYCAIQYWQTGSCPLMSSKMRNMMATPNMTDKAATTTTEKTKP